MCGDRNYSDASTILEALSEFSSDRVLIHGDCRGADRLGAAIGLRLGMKVKAYPADWKTHGRAAGPIRNREMLRKGRPTVVLAFHKSLHTSRGTKDMVECACRAGVDVVLID